jgi:hypothetical protein
MQALDSFISPIPGFDGDILFPAVPVSARPPGDESVGDPSTGASASASKTQAGKWKASVKLPPSEKGQESLGEILRRDQNQQTCTQGSCFDSSIGSSAKDPDPSIKKVHSS